MDQLYYAPGAASMLGTGLVLATMGLLDDLRGEIKKFKPDLIVLTGALGDPATIQIVRDQLWNGTAVIGLADVEDPDLRERLRMIGMVDVYTKPITSDDLYLAVRRVLDRRRLTATGGSYGGFMTNWIITQTPRFKAAVSHASVSNLISFYSTSLYQDLIHAEFGGFPWDNYDQLWQWSPLRYVRQAQTPTLFIHGEQDNDVHITQAEEMYTALKRRGVETVLVRSPREGHGLREPRHRVDALERTLAWFDRYLK